MLELRNEIRACKKCNLCSLMPHQRPVPGIGPINAKLFIVGEALGKDESIVEEPFVGLCGQFLTKSLEQVGIDRKRCYISNVVKCRPTDTGKKNRPPSKKEIEACYPWLNREIDFIKPRVILGLGKIAMNFLLNTKAPMKGMTGEIYDCNGSQCICTYHPSYILVHGKKELSEFMNNLLKTKALLDGV